jgi:hypothetical protein
MSANGRKQHENKEKLTIFLLEKGVKDMEGLVAY